MNTNMKKYIYSLAMLVLGLVSCNSWDDAVTENYGDGPAIDVKVTEFTDSAFTFTLTPAAGTQFYNYIIDQNDESEADALDAAALLKGSYGNAANVKKVTDEAPTFTAKIKAEPNTTYQIYAVAASDKGIVGKVAVASVTTTDKNAPALIKSAFKPDPATKSVAVTFDQNLKRGTGAVTAVYYKEWDWENPVTVDPADITVTIKDNVATFAAPKTPNGAIVAFSWEGGAFVDAKGNKCGAFTTTYDEEEDDFIGAAVQNKKVAFEVADSVFADVKTAFKKPEEFVGVATFAFDIFRIDQGKTAVKDGDVKVTYTNEKKSTTINLTPAQWTVKGNKLTFVLPEGIEDGDQVTLSIKEGVFYDVYGNPNAAYSSSENVWWKYVTMSVDDIVGTYKVFYKSYFDKDENVLSLGNVTIEESKKGKNTLIIKDFYLDGSVLNATYDLASKTVAIPESQKLGVAEDEDGKWGALFVNAEDDGDVEFAIDAEKGTLTCKGMWGVLAYNETFTEKLGWAEAATATIMMKVVEQEATASRRMPKLKVSSKAKTLNLKKARK